MQRPKDSCPYSRWLCYSNSIAFLVSLPILFSTANGQQSAYAFRPPRLLPASVTSSAQPLPLPELDARPPVISRAVACKENGEADESIAPVQPVVLERLPPVDQHQTQAIFGTWKSFASCLRLFGDGHAQIEVDVPRHAMAGGSQQQQWTITGQYESRDDLLLVTWNDGSRSNFRWQLQGERLLLTDESGQTSQLSREQ